ncbi:helix-turn-helix domain-containing protein [Rhodoplanes sp. TEM]|uniref:Helix-turn-helix domain-containing protein n=1 Tax=Rhodoplanes tepidamans TaxID=200616 RepID=A0ABT5JD98_RHOTP|nr:MULTISPECIES: helix-turn-helix domain-containing protein [Rhodoplanes]MDC7787326.1 helix-turn-helix domain-containing protein [Rhodoplanes tepidamans]MDC7984792.1 helix-turn-helix domain-containing protein [Rhodoplanes sp. TEM]MDQ0358237.1 Ner family transcriptional regulator [Rhodoplanes tepidamans]
MRKRRWDRHAIKAEVHRRGMTLLGIARGAGLEPSACKVALRRRNYGGERAIAAALGIEPSVLWPERYDARPVSPQQRTRLGSAATSQNAPVGWTSRGLP